MGLDSREYLRDDSESWRGQPTAAPMSIVTKIIIVTVGVYLLQLFTASARGGVRHSPLEDWLALDSVTLFHGQVWRLLTYAFLHAHNNPLHIAFNMYMLFIIGRHTVQLTGEREFVWFYGAAAIFAGLCSFCFYRLINAPFVCIGASGAVLGVFTLFVMHYPRQKMSLFGVLTVETRWLLAFFVALDAFPTVSALMQGGLRGGGTAHSAHLGGMLFGWLYFRWHMRFTTWWDRFAKRSRSARPKKSGLKVYNPETQPEPDLSDRVDTILAKISEQGEDSLTSRERRILRQASEQIKRAQVTGPVANGANCSWPDQLALWIEQACFTEVLSPKPGNVTPGSEFSDATVSDFVRSVRVTAPVLADLEESGIGPSIHQAVLATQRAVGHNTNLGIILLLAPLAAVPRNRTLPEGIERVLQSLTVADAEWTYRAIREASPGGLGDADVQDVQETPTIPLVECMRLAADRDLIARQYVTGFDDVLTNGLRWLRKSQQQVDESHRIAWVALQLIAQFGDSLIARKCGRTMSDRVRNRAANVLASGWPHTSAGQTKYSDFDAFLRSDGHQLNPGTTADMIAAIVFAGLRSGEYAVNEALLKSMNQERL